MAEATQRGSSLIDDHDARLRRDLAEAITKAANFNDELRPLRNDAQRVLFSKTSDKRAYQRECVRRQRRIAFVEQKGFPDFANAPHVLFV